MSSSHLLKFSKAVLLASAFLSAPAALAAGELTVYSAHGDDIYGPLVEAFRQANPETEVTVVVGDTGALYQRVQAESSNPAADVQWGGAIQSYEVFSDLYEVYETPNKAAMRVSDPDNKWNAFSVFAQPLMINTNLVSEADAPTTVAEILDPRWEDLG